MAPSRGKGKGKAVGPSARPSRSAQKTNNDVADVYQELLAESKDSPVDRPLKKRRVGASGSASKHDHGNNERPNASSAGRGHVLPSQQIVEDSSQSENEDSDDLAFEDVDLNQPAEQDDNSDENEITEDVSISISPTTTTKRRTTPRKPISQAEKSFRLLIHKAHILCLLGHCMFVNGWCNNEVVHRHLRSTLLSKKTISYLNPKTDDSQFQRNRSFMDGLEQASDAFRGAWVLSGSGLRRARWPDEDLGLALNHRSDSSEPMDRSDFIAAAKNLEGSQDTANQLFCALLRSAGVEARLCCSLQVLPFGNNSKAGGTTPQKTGFKRTIFATPADSTASDSNTDDTSIPHSSTIGKVPSARRRLGQPGFAPERPATTAPSNKKKMKVTRKLTHPIFWTEAFNAAQQKWVPLDPIVTQSIGKQSKIEPPSSYDLNQMNYVVAFEADGVARDITRRYARAYNAKTRRTRVEITGEEGSLWLKKALRIFRRRGGKLDREQLEDAELAQREAREGLPANVQDFKSHPYYALERHLKRHEVIHPKREVGKVNAGTAKMPRMEIVYRREDVLVCRSAEKWFRQFGREVVKGEQGIKYVSARKSRRRDDGDAEGNEEEASSPLYAYFQTTLYVPPPVFKCKVPKNAYGNIDVYVASMVPAGGVHIRHSLAQHAAKVLRVDYADAVTGFKFQGRHGTPVTEGVVVAAECAEAIQAVVDGLQDEQVEDESKARSALALRMWRRFLTGLRIKERVSGYGVDGNISKEIDEQETEQYEAAQSGGFFPGEALALPTAGRFSLEELITPPKTPKRGKKRVGEGSEEEAEFTSEDAEDSAPEVSGTRQSTRASTRKIVDEESDEGFDGQAITTPVLNDEAENGVVPNEIMMDDNGGGGFIPDDGIENGDGGGGFIPDGMEIEDDNAGGFLPDEAEPHASNDGGFSPDSNAHNEPDGHRGLSIHSRGFAIENASSQEKTLALDNAVHGKLLQGGPNCDVAMQDHEEMFEDEAGIAQQSKKTNANGVKTDDKLDEEPEHESDDDSMLSHDPEDEDAEPDWLESD